MNRWLYVLMLVAISSIGCNKSLAPEETQVIEETVKMQNYIFRAETVSPLSSRNIPLAPGYDLRVTGTTIIATLPYYGRAYIAPIDPNHGGIRFTSKRFQYTATPDNKGEWDVLIIPEDVPDVQQLRLNISAGGRATLHVTSRDRQAITFYGSVLQNKAATDE